MKKFIAFGALVTLLAALVAIPALAADTNHIFQNNGNGFSRSDNGRFDSGLFNGFNNNDRFDRFNNNDNRFNNNDPAVQQAIGQESETGNVNITGTANQSGNNSNQCVTPLQFGNTGSLQNAQGVLQYGSNSGDIELEGSNFTFHPTLNANCDQKVQQSAAASG